MINKKLFAVALFVTTPAFASPFMVNFENNWSQSNGDINEYYNGGAAADSSTGPNLGISFVNVSGFSNDGVSVGYSNAPSPQGIAYAHDTAYMNIAAGVDSSINFYYSSAANVSGAVTAWSGLNGTGTLLGSLDLTANNSGSYDNWSQAIFNFTGTAQSFNLTALGNINNVVGIDNISNVPVPAASWLFGAGLAVFGAISQRRKAAI